MRVHGFLSREGIRPAELLHIGREQLRPYANVEYRAARATRAASVNGTFEVGLADGSTVGTRKIVLATGVSDELPARPGFAELWGRGVYHCPYCHGWEVRDRPLAVLANGDQALAYVILIRNWSRGIVLLTDGAPRIDQAARDKLGALGVPVRNERSSRLEGAGSGRAGLRRIIFDDDTAITRERLLFVPSQSQRSSLPAALGCDVVAIGSAAAVSDVTW